MRQALRNLYERSSAPEHFGLAYDTWAPVGDGGKIPENDRPGWFTKLASITIPSDYEVFFNTWKWSFSAAQDRLFTLQLKSRLLLGHGNSSATGIGLTVHHTWGVPIIPGSALKGLLAHYIDAVYGPDTPELEPWEQPSEEGKTRSRYQGPVRSEGRILRGPGDAYRALFGSGEADRDKEMLARDSAAGACAGLVTFHDALYVPHGAGSDQPFAADVLTVHQRSYYNNAGEDWPNDYDAPNPVGFVSVRPETRFLVALSGPADWTELAWQLLRDALQNWGVGGKTSTGYGRGEVQELRSLLAKELTTFDRKAARANDVTNLANELLGMVVRASSGDELAAARVAVAKMVSKSPEVFRKWIKDPRRTDLEREWFGRALPTKPTPVPVATPSPPARPPTELTWQTATAYARLDARKKVLVYALDLPAVDAGKLSRCLPTAELKQRLLEAEGRPIEVEILVEGKKLRGIREKG